MFNLFQVLNCSLEKQEYECEIIPYYGEDKTKKTFEEDLTKLKEVSEGVVIFIKTADNIIKSFLQINSNN